jgi:hypothetical protein
MTTEYSGPAFPSVEHNDDGSHFMDWRGMSIRDYFAAKALPIVASIADLDNVGCLDVALAAYEWADAMLEARK